MTFAEMSTIAAFSVKQAPPSSIGDLPSFALKRHRGKPLALATLRFSAPYTVNNPVLANSSRNRMSKSRAADIVLSSHIDEDVSRASTEMTMRLPSEHANLAWDAIMERMTAETISAASSCAKETGCPSLDATESLHPEMQSDIAANAAATIFFVILSSPFGRAL